MAQPANISLSLHTGDPGLTGAAELTGGSYARQSLNTAFAAASNNAKLNNVAIEFPGMPAVTVTYVGIWAGTNFMCGGALTDPTQTLAGSTLRFSPANLSVSMA